ncbi:L,D-transpeptidase family protein [Desulfurobacterium atlanticum]|uniref:Murein L,D-transpeptidase YafK n=1 Tax=Desulfurobacterium atlanticum TaxID=240169 RepID=A0A238YP63_9BACT|nr:L,D-transpeptidase family protein [Desulfurobacterium atlanticum]SNR72792.1 Murein L,D-transpeptidase YafK [Desulfurobacterium atlanticum]
MRRKFLVILVVLLSTFNVSATTLTDVIKAIKQGEIDKAYYMEKNLSQEDKKVVEILLLLYQDKLSDARVLAGQQILDNVVYLPEKFSAVVVDKVKEKLYVVVEKNGIPVVLKTFNCITGKRFGDKLKEGDQRTPEGIYIPLYWKSNLPPFYGIGAYVLNYPNLIDRKILKRNGHGIWIHGMEGDYRPSHSTNGCIVLKNSDLRELKRFIVPGQTPVVIVDRLSKASIDSFIKERNSLVDFVYKWKTAWENSPKDIDSYFSFYSKNFVSQKYSNINSWKEYKKRITEKKKWIKIKISKLSIAKDGRLLKFGRLYLITFDMDYRSNNYNWKGRKLLYITKEGKEWKILGEESL